MLVDLPGTYTVDQILTVFQKAAKSLASSEESWTATKTEKGYKYVPGSVKKVAELTGILVVRRRRRWLFSQWLEIELEPIYKEQPRSYILIGLDCFSARYLFYREVFPSGWKKEVFEKFLAAFYDKLTHLTEAA